MTIPLRITSLASINEFHKINGTSLRKEILLECLCYFGIAGLILHELAATEERNYVIPFSYI